MNDTMNKSQIAHVASHVESVVAGKIVEPFYEKVRHSPRLSGMLPHFEQLKNRSREYHNPSFVVLVVGPVKSGKSTFVNLVARKYVSPTHFLECTVRPSLISSGGGNTLKVYRSLDTEKREAQMNEILDCLNGLTDESRISGVKVETHDYSRDSVDTYIKTNEISIAQDDILLTSIQTDGGRLLQENVFLVDMAGFDGKRVHFDTPSYKAIIERADLIVFVQSSNSAISKVSGDFFKLLQEKNSSVPVCLVHNVFESAFWRSDEQKKRDIKEQKEYAVEQIRSTYKLTLDAKNAFNLNLGKVADLRSHNYEEGCEDVLKAEEKNFEEAEKGMYELFGLREEIRLKNCVVRTKIQRDLFLSKVEEKIQEYRELQDQYDAIAAEFDALKKDGNGLLVPEIAPMSLDDLRVLVKNEYESAKHTICGTQNDRELSTDEARDKVRMLMSKIEERITDAVASLCKDMENSKNSEAVVLWFNKIHNLSSKFVPEEHIKLALHIEEPDVDVEPEIDVNELIRSRKTLIHLFRGHTKEHIISYYKFVQDSFCGYESEGTMVVGYLEDKLYPEILSALKSNKDKVVAEIVAGTNAEIDRLKQLSLQTVIPRIAEFRQEQSTLEALKNELEELNITINSNKADE